MSKRRTSSVTSLELAQALNKLRIKALVIKDIFLSLGTEHYTPLIDVFARSEDRPLTPRERIRIRQMMNAQVYQDDIPLLNLCERAANHYRKQQSNGQAT